MAYLTGRSGIPIKINDTGHIVSFFNDYSEQKEMSFYDQSGTLIAHIPDFTTASATAGSFRYLQYRFGYSNSKIKQSCKAVLYFDGTKGTEATYLFEAIHSVACKSPNDTMVLLTFWSNLKDNQTFSSSTEGSTDVVYNYESSKVLRIDQDNLDNLSLSDTAKYRRAYCQCSVQFRYLYVVEGTTKPNSFANNTLEVVPVIYQKPCVLDEIDDNNLILDFVTGSASGGSGGGLKQHMHIPNVDPQSSNFAAAVFMPGTGAPAYPWKI